MRTTLKIGTLLALLFLGAVGIGGKAGAQIPTPASLQNPSLYLIADAGLYTDATKATAATTSIGCWADQSGNGNDFTQTSNDPLVGGGSHPGNYVAFSNNSYLTGGSPAGLNFASSNYSVVIVTSASGTNYATYFAKCNSDGYQRLWLRNPGQTGEQSGRTSLGVCIRPKVGGVSIITYTYTASGGTVTENVYLNGTLMGTSTGGTPGSWDTTDPYVIGNIPAKTQYGLNCNVYAEIVYNTALSDTSRRIVESTLGAYYGLPVQPAPDMKRQIVVTGDSLAYGQGATTYGDVAFQLLRASGWRSAVCPVAFSATTTNNWIASGSFVDSLYNASYSKNFLLYYEIVNDLNRGDTPAQCYSQVMSYCSARRTKGYKVILYTCCRNNFDTDANRNTVNALLKADFTTTTTNPYIYLPSTSTPYADVLIDLASDPVLGPVSGVFTADGTHQTDAGYAIWTSYTLSAMNLLDPPAALTTPKRRLQ